MVSLEDFIAETLIQIVRGSVRAQTELGAAATINPPNVKMVGGPLYNRGDGTITRRPSKKKISHTKHSVDFDVQITASSGSETKGNAGVKLHVFSAGTSGQSTKQSEHVNRVQFSIPIVFDPSSVTEDTDSGDS